MSHAVAIILYELKKYSTREQKRESQVFDLASSKEIYDSLQKKNQFDQHDVAATVLGGVSFSLVIKLDAINFGSEAKRKKKKRKKQKK